MTEEAYAHPIYSYATLLDTQFLKQGNWSGGPIEEVSVFEGRRYLRFPNEAAANAAEPTEEQDFRLATAEEITAAGLDDLAAYASAE